MKNGDLKFWFMVVVFFVAFWFVLLSFYNPFEVVDLLGVNNSYLVIFLVSILDSILTLTYLFSYPLAGTLISGGLSFFLIGVFIGVGTTIGDVLFFYVGHTGRSILPDKLEKFFEKVFKWLSKKPQWVLDLGVLLYVGASPFPNNVLTVVGGLTNYPLRKLVLPLLVGNVFLAVLFCYLVSIGMSLI